MSARVGGFVIPVACMVPPDATLFRTAGAPQ